MKIALFEQPDKVGVDELNRDLLLLPLWRKKKALSYHHLVDQVQCAKAYILLKNMLAEEYGMVDIPEFEYGEYGKPLLKQVHFNLSHCCKGVICVVDDQPIGCDIEVIPDELDIDVLNTCFSLQEQNCIFSSSNPKVEFARLWTAKESLLKLLGIGLIDDLPSLLTSNMAKDVNFSTQVSLSGEYVYTIARKI